MGIEVFKKHLREKRVVEIIVNSNDKSCIDKICQSAQVTHTSAVIIPSDRKSYEIARKNTKLPIIVSSSNPFEILESIKWKADGIEIGNYNKDILSTQQIYDIAIESLSLINSYDVFTCVVIPYEVETQEQIELIKKLDILGVNLIRIDNKKSLSISDDKIFELTNKCNIPIVVSTNINQKIVQEVFSTSAYGIGIKFKQDEISSKANLETMMMSVISSISYRNSINKELIKSQRELLFS